MQENAVVEIPQKEIEELVPNLTANNGIVPIKPKWMSNEKKSKRIQMILCLLKKSIHLEMMEAK